MAARSARCLARSSSAWSRSGWCWLARRAITSRPWSAQPWSARCWSTRASPNGRVGRLFEVESRAQTLPARQEPAMKQAVLEARNICKSYGPVPILEDVSIEAHAGRVLVLLGDNGAGKSTLIKILSGVTAPSAGALLMDGQPVSFQTPRDARQRGIATVFQDLAVCN